MLNYMSYHTPTLRVFSIVSGLGGGGAERWWVDLVKHARTVKHVGVLIINEKENAIFPEVAALPHAFVNDSDQWKVHEKGMELLKQIHGADIIMMFGLGEQANTFLKYSRLPSVQISHSEASLLEQSPHPWYRQYLERLRNADVNFLASVSESSAYLFDEYKRKRSPVKVIHNGVSLERCMPTRSREVMRFTMKIAPQAKVVLYNGRYIPEKHPEVAVEAMQFLPDDWVLVMHGHGEKDLTNRCAAIAEGLPPSRFKGTARVKFVSPSMTMVGDFLNMADVQVVPSQTEAFPLTWIEAWISGTRLITTDIPTIYELFRKYNNGEPFTEVIPRPPIAEQLAHQILNPKADYRDLAQKIAAANFSISACVGQWEEHLHELHRRWIWFSQSPEVIDIVPASKQEWRPPETPPREKAVTEASEASEASEAPEAGSSKPSSAPPEE